MTAPQWQVDLRGLDAILGFNWKGEVLRGKREGGMERFLDLGKAVELFSTSIDVLLFYLRYGMLMYLEPQIQSTDYISISRSKGFRISIIYHVHFSNCIV